MKNSTRWIFFAILFFNYCNVFAQACPPREGGYQFRSFGLDERLHFYPASVPAGAPAGSNGASTVLIYQFHNLNIPEAQKSIFTVYPTLDGSTYGSVQVIFPQLDFGPGTVLKIYAGTTNSGTVLEEITSADFASKMSANFIHNGPITVEFFGVTAAPDYSNVMRITTGDMTIPSCNPDRSNTVVWKNFITPDSYTIVDDMHRGGVGFYQSNALLPACIAYFDVAKNYVRSEHSWCLDYSKSASTPGYGYYPGEVTFTLGSETSYDVDGNGFDAATDNLKIARLLWILDKAKTLPPSESQALQEAVWQTQDNPVNHSFTAASYAQQAQAAITSVPNPIEPTFAVELVSPTPAQQPINTTMTVRIPFSWSSPEAGQTNEVTLSYPAGLNVSLVSGGTLSGSTLTFSGPEAILNVTSATPGKYALQAIYANEDYFNINNLQVYSPCDPGVQRFLHIGAENHPEPFRSLDLQFYNNATPVRLSHFDVSTVVMEALLQWGTTEEVDFSHFEVMKSYDLNHWETLGTVSTNLSGTYQFTNAQLRPGKTTYYRLKMVDLDGTFEYSTIRSVNVEGGAKLFTVYPNPASEILYLNYADLKQLSSLTIYDERGNTHLIRSGADLLHGISIAKLPQGIHFVQVRTNDGEVYSDKLLIRN